MSKEIASPTNYRIYLVNNSNEVHTFWCFLQKPVIDTGGDVYANSNTSLRIGTQGGTNSFTIPLQYRLGAGASNNAVGLDTKINSNITNDVELRDIWLANYFNVSDEGKRAPEMAKVDGEAPEKTMKFQASNFNKPVNEANGWFSNASFGIQTSEGFMGTTWSPSPGDDTTILPVFTFYINRGKYKANQMAEFTTVSAISAEVPLTAFDLAGNATVTLTAEGKWEVTSGKPKSSSNLINSLVASHLELSRSQSSLVDMVKSPNLDNYDPKSLMADYDRMMAIAKGTDQKMLDPLTAIASVVGITVGVVQLIRWLKEYIEGNHEDVEVNIAEEVVVESKGRKKQEKATLIFNYTKGVHNNLQADKLTNQALKYQIKEEHIKDFTIKKSELA